jgi:predicted ATPase
MKLSRVYARFYKSFNFDHIRKASGKAPSAPWETFEGHWFPFVEVPIEPDITAVVGANESGKSHLLSAIEKAVTGLGISTKDVCRYSEMFQVARDRRYWPHVGVEWREVSPQDAQVIGRAVNGPEAFDHFTMFRYTPDKLDLWLPVDGGVRKFEPDEAGVRAIEALLPKPFRIDPNVALPGSVPLSWLSAPDQGVNIRTSRRERALLLDKMVDLTSYISDANSITQHAGALFNLLHPLVEFQRAAEKVGPAELRLVRELLFNLADIDPKRFEDLAGAIADGEDGYANAITQEMNAQLERRLNFRRWWVQDRDFSLRLSTREREVVFTIRDRTGTEYTFDERSSGLKYFLSYLIQSQANRGAKEHAHILLMDEPDAHLSAEAQQDLLRIFGDLADPRTDQTGVQVVYVTHSPFLLDKNHAERIRVLEKGRNLDGTRVIHNAGQNHYEPLRSAFGAFVGETAFVGSVNLLVEGAADQILLAGAARQLRRQAEVPRSDILDLNQLVIVPCNGASQIPYMVYLIRGRDADKPPVIALLDADEEGRAAAKLMSEDKKFRRLISKSFVLLLSALDFKEEGFRAEEIEDLIPLPLALAAANLCLEEIRSYQDGEVEPFNAADLEGAGSLYTRIEAAAAKRARTFGKVTFARAVLTAAEAVPEDAAGWLQRMRVLFRLLNEARREAEARTARGKISVLVEGRVRIFMADYPEQATAEQVEDLFKDIRVQLDESNEADQIQHRMRELSKRYRLEDEPTRLVEDFPALQADLVALKDAMAVQSAQKRKGRPLVSEAPPAAPDDAESELVSDPEVVADIE